MGTELHETDLKDMHGTEHHYYTIPLPFDEALALKVDLLDVALGPAIGALGALTADGEDSEPNAAAVIGALSGLPQRIAAKGSTAMVARLLATTQRVIDGKRRKLSEPVVRTEAFSGGNWVEFYSVIAWVVKVNYGPFLTELARRFGLPLSGLLDGSETPAA
jgi:hypothetical protein